MEQIFEWLREQIGDRKENCSSITMIDVNRVHNIIDEAEAKWEAEYCEWTIDISNINSAERWVYYNKIGCNPNVKDCLPTFHFSDREQKNFLKYCPYCGKRIKISEVE